MWLPGQVFPHLLVKFSVEVDGSSYSTGNLLAPRRTQTRNVLALTNSGKQMAVVDPQHTALLGVKDMEYLAAKMTIQVADNRTMRVLGMAILKITMVGTIRTTRQ